MRLSEAIRLGAMLRPQGAGDLWAFGRSCAIGSACEAIGLPYGSNSDAACDFFDKTFPWNVSTEVSCPICGYHDEVGYVIADLNDDHLWTREQIADWVQTIEPQETDAPVEQPEPVPVVAG